MDGREVREPKVASKWREIDDEDKMLESDVALVYSNLHARKTTDEREA